MDDRSDLTPLVLLVDDQEWTSRSIESILRPKGHVVLKAYTGQQALDLIQKVSPDALIVDFHLPDIHGVELVRRLRTSPTIQLMTPVLMITGGSLGRAERLDALAAGAWDVLAHPVEPHELVLRMETFVRAKQDADRLREEGLTDPTTGFYNARGILRRAREVGADAIRSERPLTCVAFGPQVFSDAQGEADRLVEVVSGRIAEALRAVTRVSDTIGRLGAGEFIVVAPGTNQEGAVRLADRVFEALDAATLERSGGSDGREWAEIRAGFCTIGGDQSSTPEDLLLRATMALRRAQSDEGSFRVRAYDA